MEILLVWIAFGWVTALAAQARGRSAGAWFGIGILAGPFGLLAVLVMENLKGRDGPGGTAAPDATRAAGTAGIEDDGRDPIGEVVRTHRGVPIRIQGSGFNARGRRFATIDLAERHIDGR